ncbi:FAD-dependent oxidoreductase [Occallatibacter riparius]|uniref:FAD-dependent oxidoreductase n=1 Tax=Occallatibacter riparius TaxID=1002689 RepID=A0A9J7BJJ1_9BACT|nr:FAD-dependent oxidoreductase [Occallatibacter riparius]UWZ82633.1 FAD-dependent oxidoreductase [Occallatibacter riparius]
MEPEVLDTTCCVVGGGPAGVMLGYLLARRGVAVTVLEKHADFFRDFRGDTVHPSTLEVLRELGLLDEFLSLPHQQIKTARLHFGDENLGVADFSHLPATCRFVALMPQWDFLNFLTSHARNIPQFQLRMQHEVTNLLSSDDRITGVIAQNESREVHVRADLVVGCDGRHSITRKAAGLEVIEQGVPIDVLWFRISRKPDDPGEVLGNVNYGRALILINRSTYFQAGFIIPKGSYDDVRSEGLEAFRASIVRIVSYLSDRVHEIQSWDQVKILTVQINRLRRWYREGLLCIGDAAHAMSPAGGVGINLAIQDAVAAANILAEPLLAGRSGISTLAAVQRRRDLPTRITQGAQSLAHRGFSRIFAATGPMKAPWQIRVVTQIPGVQRLLGHAIGMGAQPEHVRPAPQQHPRRSRRSSFVPAAIGFAAAGVAIGFMAWRAVSRTQSASA